MNGIVRGLIKTLPVIIIILRLTVEADARAFTPPADILEARELIDHADLRPIEGLWSYPEDDVTVLIFRDETVAGGKYGIYVVESADCSLSAGQKIGTLSESPDTKKFKLTQFTTIKKGLLQAPCDATATLSGDGCSITVTKPSIKVTFRPNRLLPAFWRMVNIGVKNPNSVPQGLIKVYPSYDGNDSRKRDPGYL